MWRGILKLQAKDFQFAMGLGTQPTVDETSERMLVGAAGRRSCKGCLSMLLVATLCREHSRW
jgi:hypothetical protein